MRRFFYFRLLKSVLFGHFYPLWHVLFLLFVVLWQKKRTEWKPNQKIIVMGSASTFTLRESSSSCTLFCNGATAWPCSCSVFAASFDTSKLWSKLSLAFFCSEIFASLSSSNRFTFCKKFPKNSNMILKKFQLKVPMKNQEFKKLPQKGMSRKTSHFIFVNESDNVNESSLEERSSNLPQLLLCFSREPTTIGQLPSVRPRAPMRPSPRFPEPHRVSAWSISPQLLLHLNQRPVK